MTCDQNDDEVRNFFLEIEKVAAHCQFAPYEWCRHLPGLNVRIRRPLFPVDLACKIFFALEREVHYLTDQKVTLYGTEFKLLRQHVAYGTHPALSFKYPGGLVLNARPLTPVIGSLLRCIRDITDTYYDFVIVNRFANGKDCLGFHTDSLTELVSDAGTACVLFGASREVIFRNCGFVSDHSYTLSVTNGTLLKTSPPTPDCYNIGVSRKAEIKEPTLFLEFKKIGLSEEKKATWGKLNKEKERDVSRCCVAYDGC